MLSSSVSLLHPTIIVAVIANINIFFIIFFEHLISMNVHELIMNNIYGTFVVIHDHSC